MNKLADYLIFKNGSTSPERSPELPFPVFGSNGIIGNSASANVEIASVIIGRVGTYCGSVFYSPTPAHVTDNAMYATPIKSGQTRYWYYVLKNLNLHRLRHGSGQPLLNQTILKQIDFKAHPIEEQHGISATLGALDDKIESNRRAMTLAQDLGDALFERVDSSHVKLEEIADIVMGTSPKGEFLNETGIGLPFYQGTRDFGFRFPTLRVWTTDPKRQANSNDVLLSVRAPVGDLNRASQTCCIGRGIAAIQSVDFPSTLYYAMRGSTNVWEKFNAEGTVFGSVTKNDVHEALIKWPKCENLAPLEERLSVIDQRIASLEQETQYLATLRDCLLPELMSGRVSVRVMEVSG